MSNTLARYSSLAVIIHYARWPAVVAYYCQTGKKSDLKPFIGYFDSQYLQTASGRFDTCAQAWLEHVAMLGSRPGVVVFSGFQRLHLRGYLAGYLQWDTRRRLFIMVPSSNLVTDKE